MKVGKVSENVLKRSILKQVKTKREEILVGAAVGEDCAAFKLADGETVVMSTDPITASTEGIGYRAIFVACNDIACAGATPIGVMVSALLPESITEPEIKKMAAQAEEAAAAINVQIMGGHTEITRAVSQPILTVTAVGKVKDGQIVRASGAKALEDVVLTKWIGLEGTAILAREKETELLERFPAYLIETAKTFDEHISIQTEAATAVKSGVSAMHDVTEGGIFGALWEIAECSGVGLEIDLKKIPIRQETIEICEYFGRNPYELISSGSLLMTTKNGYGMVRELEKAGIPAAVIGKTTAGNDRILYNEDEERFLEPAKQDEIYKIL